jgi:peroxiredoxin
MIEEREPAPDSEPATDTGERGKLSDHREQPILLDFHPKDGSPPPFDSMSA